MISVKNLTYHDGFAFQPFFLFIHLLQAYFTIWIPPSLLPNNPNYTFKSASVHTSIHHLAPNVQSTPPQLLHALPTCLILRSLCTWDCRATCAFLCGVHALETNVPSFHHILFPCYHIHMPNHPSPLPNIMSDNISNEDVSEIHPMQITEVVLKAVAGTIGAIPPQVAAISLQPFPCIRHDQHS